MLLISNFLLPFCLLGCVYSLLLFFFRMLLCSSGPVLLHVCVDSNTDGNQQQHACRRSDHLQPPGSSSLFRSSGRLLFSTDSLHFSEFSDAFLFTLKGALLLTPLFFLFSFALLKEIHCQLICVTVACRPGSSRFFVLFPNPCMLQINAAP